MSESPSHVQGYRETKAAKAAERYDQANEAWAEVEAERRAVDERTAKWWFEAGTRAADESLPARDRAFRLVEEMFELIVIRLRPLMTAVERTACHPGGPLPHWGVQLAELISEVRPEADGVFLAKVIIGAMRSEMVEPGQEDTLRVNVLALTSIVLGD